MKFKLWKVISTLILSFLIVGCTVKLVDQTGPNLTNNIRYNIQTFEANVRSQGTAVVNGVSIELDGGPSGTLNNTSDNTWQTDISLGACEQLVSYRFIVDYSTRSGSSSKFKRYPEVGSYAQPIANSDPICTGIASATKTFNVNTSEDLIDYNPGDGICDTGTGSQNTVVCSLRAAIMEANARQGVDLINLSRVRYTLTRVKTGVPESDAVADDAWGDLDITDSVVIVGDTNTSLHIGQFMLTSENSREQQGILTAVSHTIDKPDSDYLIPKIDAAGIDRVFQIHPMSDENDYVVFSNIAILNGLITDREGSGIFNQSRLRLERVAIYDNKIEPGSTSGGVFSPNKGAGISNHGVLYATEMALINNKISLGSGFAGGLWGDHNSQGSISQSLIALNAARFAGGIFIDSADDDESNSMPAKLDILNTTITANDNTGSVEFAISNTGELTLNFVTLTNNNKGGLRAHSNAFTQVKNTLIAYNGPEEDCRGAIDSLGANIIDYSTCEINENTLVPDVINPSQSVILSNRLVYRGGFTYVIPLSVPSSESPGVINPIDQILLAIPKPQTDQRGTGFPRAVDADGDGLEQMDIGAFEYEN